MLPAPLFPPPPTPLSTFIHENLPGARQIKWGPRPGSWVSVRGGFGQGAHRGEAWTEFWWLEKTIEETESDFDVSN